MEALQGRNQILKYSYVFSFILKKLLFFFGSINVEMENLHLRPRFNGARANTYLSANYCVFIVSIIASVRLHTVSNHININGR